MNAFFDTNVLVAAVTADTGRSEQAIELLNEIDSGYTSILNVMELRSVLTKKKAFDRERVERIEDRSPERRPSRSLTPPISSPQIDAS